MHGAAVLISVGDFSGNVQVGDGVATGEDLFIAGNVTPLIVRLSFFVQQLLFEVHTAVLGVDDCSGLCREFRLFASRPDFASYRVIKCLVIASGRKIKNGHGHARSGAQSAELQASVASRPGGESFLRVSLED